MKLDDRDWSRLSLPEKIRCLEVEGCVVLPDLIDDAGLATLRAALAALEPQPIRPGSQLWYVPAVQWSACAPAVALIAHPPALAFLRAVLGDEVTCMNASYARTDPGYPGMPLHADCAPYGSALFGPIASVPISVRFFYYLDDLTPERAPLRVLPYSHLSLHRDATPYRRHRAHPEEVTITCRAGTAVVLHGRLFHAAGANRDVVSRALYTISYRPSWAGPVWRVPPHDRDKLAQLPPAVRALFGSPNGRRADPRVPIAPGEASAAARGLGPGRWSEGAY